MGFHQVTVHSLQQIDILTQSDKTVVDKTILKRRENLFSKTYHSNKEFPDQLMQKGYFHISIKSALCYFLPSACYSHTNIYKN